MSKLPVVSDAETVRALERAGWHMGRRRGSQVILLKPGHIASLSVPQHRQLAPGTLRSLLRAAGIDPEEFRDLL